MPAAVAFVRAEVITNARDQLFSCWAVAQPKVCSSFVRLDSPWNRSLILPYVVDLYAVCLTIVAIAVFNPFSTRLF